ncbi:hypothetical protein [Vogesella indigofera]|uniref:hypothetical protein n=1 Tax=Vogesella indigofera TaxID=45465 RepID=UPI00234EB7D6|nr:hypothetical protein [Vogesella indigofera]MDC7697242.1 hypothetical protein [Vogesella indigofera]
MRKAIASPSFEHYLKAIDNDDQCLVTVLKGHLVVEALLVELLELHVPADTPWKWNFPTKTTKCVEFGLITTSQAEALNELNNIRNDFAHVLGQRLGFGRVFGLVQKAAAAGFEFTDDTIHQDEVKSKIWYDTDGCIVEVLNSFYSDLAMLLLEHGGPDRIGG